MELVQTSGEVSKTTRSSRDSAPAAPAADRRRGERVALGRFGDWDFFTDGDGAKSGYLVDLSENGCMLCTQLPIEHRRWIRLVIQAEGQNVFFTAIGRVVRREDRLEAWDDRNVTLHRFGVEFIHPLNSLALEQLAKRERLCTSCGTRAAQVADIGQPGTHFCVLCQLRRTAQSLMLPSESPGADDEPDFKPVA
jgi:hypothetical protein